MIVKFQYFYFFLLEDLVELNKEEKLVNFQQCVNFVLNIFSGLLFIFISKFFGRVNIWNEKETL